MGKKLVDLYKFAIDEGGAMAKARIVMKTGIIDTKAMDEADSPDNINKLRTAIKEVIGKDAP